MSNNVKTVLETLAHLDAKGLTTEVDILDSYLRKHAKKVLHRCGLEEATIESHKKLLEDYTDAKENLKRERQKILLSSNEKDNSNDSKLRDISRNLTNARNSIFLHEMYFADVIDSKPFPLEKTRFLNDNLNGLYIRSAKDFPKDLVRMANLTRSGWVLLTYCTKNKNLELEIIDLHEIGGTLCRVPVAALDMWEHAYFMDFGSDKNAYVEWWLSKLDWRGIETRIKNLSRIK